MYQVQLASNQNDINQIIDLRYAVLREPWNKAKETATDQLESISVNAFIEENKKVIACGRLQNNGNKLGQIRYMAVHPNYQQRGLGSLIIKRLEEEAKELNFLTIELQARENAVEFYKSQGYQIQEKSFNLWDIIQHYLMVKTLHSI